MTSTYAGSQALDEKGGELDSGLTTNLPLKKAHHRNLKSLRITQVTSSVGKSRQVTTSMNDTTEAERNIFPG